jgi:TM2 domain-containing membrane protein YozV
MQPANTHSKTIGYLTCIFGFMGAHRFYYGRPLTGTLWFFTFGILGIGWIIDLVLIPSMDRDCDLNYHPGPIDYNIAWLCLSFLGILGVHRFYMGKWLSGIIWLCTGGLVGLGWLYDLWTLNDQVSELNSTFNR